MCKTTNRTIAGYYGVIARNSMTIEEDYKEAFSSFKKLIQAGISLSIASGGIHVESRNLEVGSNLFAKLVFHARAILVLCPREPAGEKAPETELWDISSLAALARSLMETYYVLYYVAVDHASEEATEFRWLVWDYHAEKRRREKLELIGSTHPNLQIVDEKIRELKQALINHREYLSLNSQDQGKIRKAKNAVLSTNSDLSERAGVDKRYYKSTFMFLSSYVHSHPFSMEQLMNFKAGKEDSLGQIKVVIQYASLYLSIAIRDFRSVVPVTVDFDHQTQEKIEIWSGIAKDFSTF